MKNTQSERDSHSNSNNCIWHAIYVLREAPKEDISPANFIDLVIRIESPATKVPGGHSVMTSPNFLRPKRYSKQSISLQSNLKRKWMKYTGTGKII